MVAGFLFVLGVPVVLAVLSALEIRRAGEAGSEATSKDDLRGAS